ncbi:MAG: class I SAM-dependent methyltransferase [Elusimicrobiales bacterium]|nr:class I SAM-dependent methyltransferase [Elusimicrobiales bacterium]
MTETNQEIKTEAKQGIKTETKKETMHCSICDTMDFHHTGKLHKESEILLCKNCGAVWHNVDYSKEEEIKNYYRHKYRSIITHGNLLTTKNKLQWVKDFLMDFMKDKKGYYIGDVGCATGYIPRFFRNVGHNATGCELTPSFRRFSEHFYGIPLTEELIFKTEKVKGEDGKAKEVNKPYFDLVLYNHVLEHIMNPDKELKKAIKIVKTGSYLFISCPQFLDQIDEPSGIGLHSFEYLFHKDHINLFTKQSLQNLFRKNGLTIIKANYANYGQTYLLKKTGETQEIIKEDWKKNLAILENQKEAIGFYKKGDYEKAIEINPRFPEAWTTLIMGTKGKDETEQQDLWNKLKESQPDVWNNKKCKLTYAVWLFQREKRPEADKAFEEALKVRVCAETLFLKGQNLFLMGKKKESIHYFFASADMNPNKWNLCMDWAAKASSECPSWDEVAKDQMLTRVWEQNKNTIKLVPDDKVMNKEPALAKSK